MKNIIGLKFPDYMLVRFFFKEKIQDLHGKVLELGCGNGSNLQLFSEYNFDVVGVDIDGSSIDNANYNYQIKGRQHYLFIEDDILTYLKVTNEVYDIVLIPSVLYYITKESAYEVLDMLKSKIKLGTTFILE